MASPTRPTTVASHMKKSLELMDSNLIKEDCILIYRSTSSASGQAVSPKTFWITSHGVCDGESRGQRAAHRELRCSEGHVGTRTGGRAPETWYVILQLPAGLQPRKSWLDEHAITQHTSNNNNHSEGEKGQGPRIFRGEPFATRRLRNTKTDSEILGHWSWALRACRKAGFRATAT